MAGTVHLIMPYDSWQGRSDNPGEIAGYGAADADTCRDIAGRLAAEPAARWCITLTDQHGRAAAHGCARAGPGPPGTSDRAPGWPLSRSTRSTPAPAPTSENQPGISPPRPCGTSSRSAVGGAGSPDADGPRSAATTIIRSPATSAGGRASVTSTQRASYNYTSLAVRCCPRQFHLPAESVRYPKAVAVAYSTTTPGDSRRTYCMP
jgi:hypothetical protein